MYEVIFLDSGNTYQWSKKECIKQFGRAEFKEIEQGYLPHIVATKL